MDLRQLGALVAVADHRSFSAAADALHTVQSNVSTHVARLERELGATLVDRAAGQLTVEGEAVVARARRVGAELEALVSAVAALRPAAVGPPRLAPHGPPRTGAPPCEGAGRRSRPGAGVPACLARGWALGGVGGTPRRHVGVAPRRRGLLSGAARPLPRMLRALIADADARPPGIH